MDKEAYISLSFGRVLYYEGCSTVAQFQKNVAMFPGIIIWFYHKLFQLFLVLMLVRQIRYDSAVQTYLS